MNEDDPGWEWWSMGNNTAGASYAADNPPPSGYTVSNPYVNDAGATVVTASRTVSAPVNQAVVADNWPHLVGLRDMLEELTSGTHHIRVNQIPDNYHRRFTEAEIREMRNGLLRLQRQSGGLGIWGRTDG